MVQKYITTADTFADLITTVNGLTDKLEKLEERLSNAKPIIKKVSGMTGAALPVDYETVVCVCNVAEGTIEWMDKNGNHGWFKI